ncbi:hypothetical protein M408DRAFT_116355 [Serendipita vermifera MAFF 305830]|uniref:Uncharacterized protein n=1 Tax=Serendipita vermifera MAFF 305830 TaxID=933852 RepID=A0A0C3AYM6_SERVB|nr:hypothetical protein M408DRAFT_116355 [Serendipita vermifera MAFF 305830]
MVDGNEKSQEKRRAPQILKVLANGLQRYVPFKAVADGDRRAVHRTGHSLALGSMSRGSNVGYVHSKQVCVLKWWRLVRRALHLQPP